MMTSLKSLLKPAFMKALQVQVDRRWRRRGASPSHGLPARLIVTLTSYSKRFDVLGLTLKTLMTQTVAPDAVILWIAHDDMARLPADVRDLEQHGLTIRSTDDLRSYKKIIPALPEFSDAFLVTADDDVYYPADWLSVFVKAYRRGDRTVLAQRAHRMIVEGEALIPYDRWTFEISDTRPGWDVFFTGVGGVFYPPGVLPAETSDIETFQLLCPTGDDIWLNWMIRRNGALVRKIGPKRRFYEWPGSQLVALQNDNRGEGDANDRQIAAVVRHFGLARQT